MRLLVASLLTSLLMLSLISGCIEIKSNNISNNSVQPEYPPVVEIAKKDLAERLNIPPQRIQLISQERVDWPDTSLGFPEEGKMYAQVITPGFLILLKADDKLYEYHSDYERVVGPREI